MLSPRMHRLIAWLLVLGVFVGLGGRVLSQVGAWHVDVAVVDDCGHDHDHAPSDEDDHGPECPPGPHHHHHHLGCCCSGTLVMEELEVCRLSAAPGSRTGWYHPDEAMPDGPVLTMDKPPLI